MSIESNPLQMQLNHWKCWVVSRYRAGGDIAIYQERVNTVRTQALLLDITLDESSYNLTDEEFHHAQTRR